MTRPSAKWIPILSASMWPRWWSIAILLSAAAGCSEPTAASLAPARVRVKVATVGSTRDTSGYVLTIGAQQIAVPSDADTSLWLANAGTQAPTLAGVARNCTAALASARTRPNSLWLLRIDITVRCDSAIGDAVLVTAYPGIQLLQGVPANPRSSPFLPDARQGVVSPDGREVAFTDAAGLAIVRVGSPTVRRTIYPPSLSLAYVSWSPDGTRLAFAATDVGGSSQVYVIASDGSGLRQLTSGSGAIHPVWSPLDERILAVQPGGLVLLQSDGSQWRELPTLGMVVPQDPSWSRDASQIAFVAGVQGTLKVFAMDLGTNRVRQITRGPDQDGRPVWSPDGRYLVFGREIDGQSTVFSVLSDGSNGELTPIMGGAPNSWARPLE